MSVIAIDKTSCHSPSSLYYFLFATAVYLLLHLPSFLDGSESFTTAINKIVFVYATAAIVHDMTWNSHIPIHISSPLFD